MKTDKAKSLKFVDVLHAVFLGILCVLLLCTFAKSFFEQSKVEALTERVNALEAYIIEVDMATDDLIELNK